MNRRRFYIGIAALLLALAAGGAYAQELQLKESDIRKLIPLLRAQAADLGAAQAMAEREGAARTSFSGDPLEFFGGRAKLDLPHGLTYVPGCSRAVSFRGPVAIFTFGREIDCYERAYRDIWRGVKRGPDEKLPSAPNISPACWAEHQQTVKLLNDTQRALENRGFQFAGTGPGGEPIYLNSPGERFLIAMEWHNAYDKAEPEEIHPLHLLIGDESARNAAIAACSDMPSGPIMEVHPGKRFFEKEPLDTLDVELRKSGLKEEEFDAMRTALFMARLDTKPEWWEAAEYAASKDPALQRQLATRRHNRSLYLMFAAELDPLLDALLPKQ